MPTAQEPDNEIEEEDPQLPTTEEDDVLDDDETDGSQRSRKITLSRRIKRDLGEWLQANPFLYDRAAPGYKNASKKKTD